MASVMGRSFYVRILEHLGAFEELMLVLYLATLEEFEYINKLKAEPDLEYMFRHPLLQEVVYNSLLKKRRKELHRRTGEAIEKIFHNRLDDFAEILAYQYINSDNPEKAIEWQKKAGHKAKERYANDKAIGYFEKVISIIKQQELVGAIHELPLIDAYEALGDVHNLKAEYEQAIKNYEEMFDNATDKIVKAKAKRKIALVCQNQSRYDDALKILESAEQILKGDSVDEIKERGEIHILRCWILRIKGEMAKALKEGEIGLDIIERLKIEDLEIDEKEIKVIKARAFNNLGMIFLDKGDYDKAVELYQKRLKISEEIGDKRGIGIASNNLGIVYHDKGDYDKAVEYYQKYLKISEEIGDKQSIGIASGNLGIVYYDKGDYDKAVELYQKGLKICEEIGNKRGIGRASNNLGIVYHYKGDYDKAVELYQKYLKICEEIGDKRGIGVASGNLGVVYADKGDYDKAVELYQKSLKIYEEIGDKQGIGIASDNLGGLFLEIGELMKAEEHLLKSKEICEEIGFKENLIAIYCFLSELLIKKGEKVENAYAYADRGWKLAEEINSEPQKAECYFTYGKIYAIEVGSEKWEVGSKEWKEKLKLAEENFKKAMAIYTELRQKKSLADCYLAYAKMLKSLEVKKLRSLEIEETSEIYFMKALE
ncbi:MAG: tetratricopeptide repeat protein, partial [Candidatus Edwardsbacteria bacterium]